MKRKFLVFLILFASNLFSEHFVTYKLSAGRLGDCVLCYLHAKWISHKYNLPLQLVRFKYFEYFAFDPNDTLAARHFLQINSIADATPLNLSIVNPTKFIVTYFPESPNEREQYRRIGRPWPYFEVDWKDADFKNKISTLIHPHIPVPIVEVKNDAVNVAIHIREGGTHDSAKTREFFAAKFPSMDYYKTALKEIDKLLPNKKIYCHVFTDARNPGNMVNDLKAEFEGRDNIEFNFLNQSGVVTDFFSIFAFDVVIRSDSNFSRVPTLIKDFAIVAAPKTHLEGRKMVVEEECDIQVDEGLFEMLMGDPRTDIIK